MRKYNLKTDAMSESDLQRIYKYPIYPRDSKIYYDKAFVDIDNGSQGDTHWTCFIIKITNLIILKVFVFIPTIFYSINYLS